MAEQEDKQKTIERLRDQILGQNLTNKWSGEGHGNAASNATNMGQILSGIGITDIKQFGKIPVYATATPAEWEVDGRRVGLRPGGGYYYLERRDSDSGRYIPPEKEEKLTTTKYTKVDPQSGETVTVPKDQVKMINGTPSYDTGQTAFGNKETYQAVPNTYSERQTGNFWGGTFAGKGNTGYGVQFDAQGNPYFYTQGASSSDIGKIAPLLAVASFIPGVAPFAQGLNALIAAKEGDVLGALAGAAGLGGYTDVANAARMGKALQSGDPLAIALSGANLGGITDVGGVDLKDISSGIGAVKAIESGDPLAMLRYGMGALPKDGGVSSLGPGTPEEFSEGLIPGYFQPGGEGYVEPTIQDTTGLDEGPIIPNEIAPDIVDQLLNSGMPSPDEDFMPTLSAPTEIKPEEETDWNALYNTGLSPEEIAKREALMESLPNQEMQIDPENWESFDKNLSDIMTNKGGYTSQWQTVGNDRVMVNDDGTGIGTNENGDSYALSQEEVDSMIKNGMLNTADSGYVAATGGTGNTPGGSGPAPAAPAKPTAPVKPTAPTKTAAPVKPTAPTKPGAPTPTGTAPTTTAASNAPQQTSNADLLNLLSSKPELANIKSFKELFGEGLFGDSYVPPSALGADDGFSGMPIQMPDIGQSAGDDGFSSGGRVDNFDVDALLQILRG